MDDSLYQRANAALDQSMQKEAEFGRLIPLPDSLLPVEPFDYRLLPEGPLALHIQDIAERMQCPPDYPAISVMVALTTLIGNKIQITPKQYDKSWQIVPNLWGLIIGRPSMLKTPAMEEALKHLNRIDTNARLEYEEALKQYKVDIKYAELEARAIEGNAKKLVAQGDGKKARELLNSVPADIEPPVRKRLTIVDATIEKIGELLKENQNGLLCKRDELNGFLRTIDNDMRPNDRAFYLEAFNGNGSYTYDRIGRGTIDIPNLVLSMLGTIQPGRYAKYVNAAIRQGQGDDGLSQRFQLAVYPDEPKLWCNVDRAPDSDAKRHVQEMFLGLHTHISGVDEPEILSFSEEAQLVFNEWWEELENQKLRNNDDHPALISHLAKYRSLMPSIALIIHVVDMHMSDAMPPVSAKAARKACAFCEYLESHARRIYAMALKNPAETAKLILAKISSKKLTSGFTVRTIQHKNWSGLNDNEEIKEALALLVSNNYLNEKLSKTGGRDLVEYNINPEFLDGCANG